VTPGAVVVLVTVDEDDDITVTLHATAQAAMDSVRRNYNPGLDVPDEDLIEAVLPVMVSITEHAWPVP
jgi:hypothetical protein